MTMRYVAASMLAAFVFGVAADSARNRSIAERIRLISSPRTNVPPELTKQLNVFRQLVPKGSTILYLQDEPDDWLIGLWQRSLYPDYIVIPVWAPQSEDERGVLAKFAPYKVSYAVSAGNPPFTAWLDTQSPIPPCPSGYAAIVGKLKIP